MTRDRFDMAEVKAALRGQLEAMLAERLPAARRAGAHWYAGSLGGEKGQSLQIYGDPARRGGFVDYATGETGDILNLWAALYEGAPNITGPVIERAAAWAGVAPEARPRTEAEERVLAAKREARARKAEAEAAAALRAAEGKRKFWAGRWFRAERCDPGDPVWRYLAGQRGIDPARLVALHGKLPGAIRFAPDWPFWESGGREPDHHFPAMVCQVMGKLPEGSENPGKPGVLAVHATYLEQRDGAWRAQKETDRKGRLRTRRRVFAASRGGVIPVWKGRENIPFTRAPRDAVLVITEGVEDALTAALAAPELFTAAACSLSNLRNLQSPSPKGFGEVVIAADNDWGKPENARPVARVRERIIASGRQCRVVFSDAGKDFNDWLRAGEDAA